MRLVTSILTDLMVLMEWGKIRYKKIQTNTNTPEIFTGGDSASIADLLCAATLDQTKEAGGPQQIIQIITNIQQIIQTSNNHKYSGADHAANTDYMERVREAVSAEIYDQVWSMTGSMTGF